IKDHAILGLDGSAFRARYHDWRDGCARGGRGAARRRGSLNRSVRLKPIEIAEAAGKVAGPQCRSQNRGECLQGAMVECSFIAGEKKQLVLLYRPADRPPKLVEDELWFVPDISGRVVKQHRPSRRVIV